LDLDSAWRAVRGFASPAIAIIKHTNPCGLAIAPTLAEAFPYALAGDPEAAYGGILAANRTFDEGLAGAIGSLFLECIVAPAFDEAALARLAQRPNIRLLETDSGAPDAIADACELRSVHGGLLVQQPDLAPDAKAEWHVVTRRHPSDVEERAAGFAWEVARHLKSNAVCLVQPFGGETEDRAGLALVGAGAGQMSRVDAVHMAVYKAGERARRAVLGSDAFFPFPDGVEMAAAAGVTTVIQPGGSIRDADVVAAADRLGLAMIFTAKRHFRH
jgi:phosphoribosylaminoimidazolecarboxamide formyltransferase/IMP cyclohydrolase